ncbi:hypothetical protein HGRIS_003065 [Hohenbuehelia grisea]|uniref:Uncharacterized protein n=1 Tax=Hohenbuehelia grisea TaxID=104357 RepID=A0ABR3JP94_9AGAR
MSYALPPLPLPLKHRRKSESSTDPPSSPRQTWFSELGCSSSSPACSSPSPASPTSSKHETHYTHILSSPRLRSEFSYSRTDDIFDHVPAVWSRNDKLSVKSQSTTFATSHHLPSFRASFPSDEDLPFTSDFEISDVSDPPYTDVCKSTSHPPSDSAVFYSDSEEEEEEEDDGYEFTPSDIRSTYFSTSSERGRWLTDPMPIPLRTRSSVPTVDSIFKPPLAPRPISEPAPLRELGESLPTPEEVEKVTDDGDMCGGGATLEASVDPDHLGGHIVEPVVGDIVTEELLAESDAEEPACPSSPLPPSSAPVSPMSTCISPMFGPVSPMSISPSSPLSSLPPSPLLLPEAIDVPESLVLDVLASGTGPVTPGNENHESDQSCGPVTGDELDVVIPTLPLSTSPAIASADEESRRALEPSKAAPCNPDAALSDVQVQRRSSPIPTPTLPPQETPLPSGSGHDPLVLPLPQTEKSVDAVTDQDVDVVMDDSKCGVPESTPQPQATSLARVVCSSVSTPTIDNVSLNDAPASSHTLSQSNNSAVQPSKPAQDVPSNVLTTRLDVKNDAMKPPKAKSGKGKEKEMPKVGKKATEADKERSSTDKAKAPRRVKHGLEEKPKRKSKGLDEAEGVPKRKKPRLSSEVVESSSTAESSKASSQKRESGATKELQAKRTSSPASADETETRSAPLPAKRPKPQKSSCSDSLLPSSVSISDIPPKPELHTAASDPVITKSTTKRARHRPSAFEEEADSGDEAGAVDAPDSSADAEIEGMIIESMALSRASSHTASALLRTLIQSRPNLRAQRNNKEWLTVVRRVLKHGEGGMFGKVESSFKDEDDRALEAQWFYVPEMDPDQERATLLRSLMPRAGKRSETKKYKQYYYRPLDKISRWDPEDAI